MAGEACEDFLSLVKSYLNVRDVADSGYSKVEIVAKAFSASEMNLPIVMSSAEQKQSFVKDYNKQLQEYRLTDQLKVPIS